MFLKYQKYNNKYFGKNLKISRKELTEGKNFIKKIINWNNEYQLDVLRFLLIYFDVNKNMIFFLKMFKKK